MSRILKASRKDIKLTNSVTELILTIITPPIVSKTYMVNPGVRVRALLEIWFIVLLLF